MAVDKLTLKFTWRVQRLRVANKILKEKKNPVGRLVVPDFETYYKAAVMKTSDISERPDKQIDATEQRAPKQTPINSRLIFDKGTKVIQWRSLLNNWC